MSDAITNLNLDFSSSPTIWNFLNDKSFVRGIMGPVGSGKSYACAAEIMLKAVRQKQSPRDGICLLYTSPSPRDLSTSRMPSSA